MGIQAFKPIAKQRARLIGELKKLDRRLLDDWARVRELRVQIRAYDEVLRAQGIDVDPDIYAPAVTPTPKMQYFAYGELLSLCFDALREQRRPLTTIELMISLAGAKQVRWRCPEDRNAIRRNIKNAMRQQVKRGLVVRVGTVGDAHNDVALWALPEHAGNPWMTERE